ncbi:MAG: class B sortase [Clostridia bacterium]|nr:class B sortase [Clostridia bacterium]
MMFRKTKAYKVLWLCLFILFCLVLAACFGFAAYHYILNASLDDVYEQARVEIPIPSAPLQTGTATGDDEPVTPSVGDEEVKTQVMIDFDILHGVSENIYAWVEIPETKLAYPVVQHPKNNSYYVRRSVNGKYDVSGCVFSENYNSREFTDKNTVLYGHYMFDDSKFGTLLNYTDKEYFEHHQSVYVYTPDEVLEYKIFAAVPFSTRHVLRSYRGDDAHERFLADVLAVKDPRAVIDRDIEVDPEADKILTLSTCMKTASKRFLVLAVLINSQKVNQ